MRRQYPSCRANRGPGSRSRVRVRVQPGFQAEAKAEREAERQRDRGRWQISGSKMQSVPSTTTATTTTTVQAQQNTPTESTGRYMWTTATIITNNLQILINLRRLGHQIKPAKSWLPLLERMLIEGFALSRHWDPGTHLAFGSSWSQILASPNIGNWETSN